jgi:chaperone required for assembly of F1-ATPase
MKNGSHQRPEPPKRFYKAAHVVQTPEGWQVQLDGRPVKTPKRGVLLLPTQALAEAIAAEWEAQGASIDLRSMPLTKLANTTLDGIVGQEAAVRAEIVAYAGNDLLCYRVERPERLAQLQHEEWDPLLSWATEQFGARLHTTTGVMPVRQSEDCVSHLDEAVAALNAFALASAHVMTTLTGSAVLALAYIHDRLTVEEAWTAAHLDEDFQIAQWGEDAEAKKRRDARYAEMLAAATFYRLSRQSKR